MSNRVLRAGLVVFLTIAAVAALSAHDYLATLACGGAAYYLERRMRWR